MVSGGIAGPALALFLQQAEVPCALYEAYPFVKGIGGGLGLAPNGIKVLAALGNGPAGTQGNWPVHDC